MEVKCAIKKLVSFQKANSSYTLDPHRRAILGVRELSMIIQNGARKSLSLNTCSETMRNSLAVPHLCSFSGLKAAAPLAAYKRALTGVVTEQTKLEHLGILLITFGCAIVIQSINITRKWTDALRAAVALTRRSVNSGSK
jgi:hypothetical protein